jgi:HEAT repeat protein
MSNSEIQTCNICDSILKADVEALSCDYCKRTVCSNCLNIDVPDHHQKTCNACMNGWDPQHNVAPAKTTKELIEHLLNRDAADRHQAAESLRFHRNVEAREALMKASKDTDKKVRASSVEALGDFPSQIVNDRLIELSRVDADPNTRANAAESLAGMIEHDNVLPLLESLNDPDEHVIGTACRLLGNLQSERGLGPLEKLVHNKKYGFPSHAALEAISKIDLELGQKHALKFLKRKDPLQRFTAVVIIARGGREETLPALLPMLSDPDAKIRAEAAWGVKELGQVAVPPLLQLLKDRNSDVRKSAYHFLHLIGWKPKNAAENAQAIAAGGDVNKLKNMGDAALTAVEVLIGCETRQSQIDALAILAAIDSAKATKRIRKMTKSKDNIIQAEANRTLRALEKS